MNNEIIRFKDHIKIVLKDNEGNTVDRALVDLEDEELVKKHKWHKTNTGYVIGYCKETKTKFLLHTYLLGAKDGYITDHVNGNKMDNRRQNLRHITQSENCHLSKLNIRNRTGKKGVAKAVKNNKTVYIAQIQHKGTVYNLGTYKHLEDAIEARQKKEIELLGKMLDN